MSNIIDELKAQFLDNIVEVTERKYSREFKHLGKTFDFVECNVADNDSTIANLTAVVKAKGYELRLWLPDTFGTMDFCDDRVNAYVEKANDGKYRITNLTIG